MKYKNGIIQRSKPRWQMGVIERATANIKFKRSRTLGGSKQSAGHILIEECMSNYDPNNIKSKIKCR